MSRDDGLLRGELDALRRRLALKEMQLADLAWQLTDLAKMKATPAEKRRELARLSFWTREVVDELQDPQCSSGEACRAAPPGAAPAAAALDGQKEERQEHLGQAAALPADAAEAPATEGAGEPGVAAPVEGAEELDDARELARMAEVGAAAEAAACAAGARAEAGDAPAGVNDAEVLASEAEALGEAGVGESAPEDAQAAGLEDDDTDDSEGSDVEGLWTVVGGGSTGGILVREGPSFTAPQSADRLATGSTIMELNLDGDRLEYELVSGAGPPTGWVSITFKDKDLLVRKPRPRTRSGYLKSQYCRLILWPRGRRLRPSRPHQRTFNKVCVLGPFNSGTNAIMRELPRFFTATIINKHRADSPAWWKHGIQKSSTKKVPNDIFFICMVRDPGYWIQSLARDPKDGTFNEFFPMRQFFNRGSGKPYWQPQEPRSAFQLFEALEFDGKTYTTGALSVWEETVRSYFDRRALPRKQVAVLRYEDYVFRFEEAMRSLAACGLRLKPDHPPFEALTETAKDHTHPKAARRDLGTTKQDLSDPSKRYANRTKNEVARMEAMDPELLHLLGYEEDAVQQWLA